MLNDLLAFSDSRYRNNRAVARYLALASSYINCTKLSANGRENEKSSRCAGGAYAAATSSAVLPSRSPASTYASRCSWNSAYRTRSFQG